MHCTECARCPAAFQHICLYISNSLLDYKLIVRRTRSIFVGLFMWKRHLSQTVWMRTPETAKSLVLVEYFRLKLQRLCAILNNDRGVRRRRRRT